MYNGKQYIVVAVTTNGANGGGEPIAYVLPYGFWKNRRDELCSPLPRSTYGVS